MTFKILNKLRAININQLLNIVLKSLESEIIKMNTDDQLFNKGVTIRNVKITPAYADSTKKVKIRKGQPTNRVTTRDSGSYHRSFKVAFGSTEFEVVAFFETQRGFELAGHLESIYGGLEGLTDQNVTNLTNLIRPQLIQLVRAAI